MMLYDLSIWDTLGLSKHNDNREAFINPTTLWVNSSVKLTTTYPVYLYRLCLSLVYFALSTNNLSTLLTGPFNDLRCICLNHLNRSPHFIHNFGATTNFLLMPSFLMFQHFATHLSTHSHFRSCFSFYDLLSDSLLKLHRTIVLCMFYYWCNWYQKCFITNHWTLLSFNNFATRWM